jgi:hypothetical protein
LNNRLTAFAGESLRDLRQQQAHAFRDERAVKKGNRFLILARGLLSMNRRNISRELRLLEGTSQNVAVGTATSLQASCL